MHRILIVSSSGRAIAQSALQAGFLVDVFDHFGDWDLEQTVTGNQRLAGRVICSRDDEDLLRIVDSSAYQAIVFGGGFEAKNELIKRLAAKTPILGCQPSQLGRLRSPALLQVLPELVTAAGANWPMTTLQPPAGHSPGEWICKSLGGSGGRHVRLWEPKLSNQPHPPGVIFQRYIQGYSFSAVFVAGDAITREAENVNREDSPEFACQLMGCCEQLVGEPAFGARRFSYCGSIGPIRLSDSERGVVERLGTAIAAEFEITGVFGLDLILNVAGVWLIDINPRIPASAELYERASRALSPLPCSIFGLHVKACQDPLTEPVCLPPGKTCYAKGILFCKDEPGIWISPASFNRLIQIYDSEPGSTPRLADIPQPGTQILQGDPILTLFAAGQSIDEARGALYRFAAKLYQLFQG